MKTLTRNKESGRERNFIKISTNKGNGKLKAIFQGELGNINSLKIITNIINMKVITNSLYEYED